MSGKLDSGVIGDRIDVYEDRVSGVEGWAQYRYGEDSRGQSRELFMRAVTHVEISAFVIDPAAFVDDIGTTSSDMSRHSAIQRMPIFVTTSRELGSVSTPGARFMYRLASPLASVHPAA